MERRERGSGSLNGREGRGCRREGRRGRWGEGGVAGSQRSAKLLLASECDQDLSVVELDLRSSAMDGLSMQEQDGIWDRARRDQG